MDRLWDQWRKDNPDWYKRLFRFFLPHHYVPFKGMGIEKIGEWQIN